MTAGGERQQRDQAGWTPRTGPNPTLLSADAHGYTDAVAGKQAAAARDPHLNGQDPLRRLRDGE